MADVLVMEDYPSTGTMTFTPLTEFGRDMLTSIVKDDERRDPVDLVAEGVAVWQGESACVQCDGNHADYVYQTLLIAGVEVKFPDGYTFAIDRATLKKRLDSLPPEIRFWIHDNLDDQPQ